MYGIVVVCFGQLVGWKPEWLWVDVKIPLSQSRCVCIMVLSMVLEVGQLVGSCETPRGFGGVKYSSACPVSEERS